MHGDNDKLFQNRYKIDSNRLNGHDYSFPGWYFITLCAYKHKYLFGKVVGIDVSLTELGEIAKEELLKSEEIRKEIEIHEYVIMPNHLHILVGIDFMNYNGKNDVNNSGVAPKEKHSIGMFIRGFKSAVSRRALNKLNFEEKIWQSNYYDHIVKHTNSLDKIKTYIINNPFYWDKDEYNLN